MLIEFGSEKLNEKNADYEALKYEIEDSVMEPLKTVAELLDVLSENHYITTGKLEKESTCIHVAVSRLKEILEAFAPYLDKDYEGHQKALARAEARASNRKEEHEVLGDSRVPEGEPCH